MSSPEASAARTSYAVDPDGVALLRLERPEARNAMDTQLLEELLAHLAAAREDDAVRVLVLSSSEQMGLSAGADVREKLDEEAKVRRMQLFADVYDAIVAFPKPTVAACHGDVVGGGAEVAVACDMRVGGANLRMRFPGAALGVPVGPARLVTLCGLAAAKYLLLSSRTVGADEALRIGLVNRVAPAVVATKAVEVCPEGNDQSACVPSCALMRSARSCSGTSEGSMNVYGLGRRTADLRTCERKALIEIAWARITRSVP